MYTEKTFAFHGSVSVLKINVHMQVQAVFREYMSEGNVSSCCEIRQNLKHKLGGNFPDLYLKPAYSRALELNKPHLF